MSRVDLKNEMAKQFDIFAEKMDARDDYLIKLRAFAQTHDVSEIPIEHKINLKQAMEFKPWRDDKKALARIKRASLLAAKNALGLRKEPRRFRKYREEREKVAARVAAKKASNE